jgi:AcrR family transcriptional regulator
MAKRINLHGSETRQSILAAASRLFVEQGVNNASLKDIAQAANISPGTLFYYYSSKSELIFDVTEQHFNRVTQQLLLWVKESHAQTDIRQILEVVFKTIVGDLIRGKLHHYLVEEALSNNATLRNRFLQKYQEWRQMIESGITPITTDNNQRQIDAQIILAALDGLILQAILGVEDIPFEQIADRFAACLNV